MFEIHIKDDHYYSSSDGNWAEISGCYPYFFLDPVIFATEEEAFDMIDELKKLGEEEEDIDFDMIEYQVVPVSGKSGRCTGSLFVDHCTYH